ncbi:MAG: hypothetical protein Q7T97_02250 [Burkholderiaceae bacterium]|nr:hypothetical protein [Burkholderiaceae bacterium]
MATKKFKGNRDKRDGRQFVLLPHVVLESPGYRLATHPARSLLIDIAMQYTGHNNGKLVACAKYLKVKGWNSNATIVRARHDLIDCGLLIETRKGARPNKAAWFALSWLDLDQGQGLDIDPTFYRRGAYMTPDKIAIQNTAPAPSGGAAATTIAPPDGARASTVAPPGGAIRHPASTLPALSGGAYLEIPSAGVHASDVAGGRT